MAERCPDPLDLGLLTFEGGQRITEALNSLAELRPSAAWPQL